MVNVFVLFSFFFFLLFFFIVFPFSILFMLYCSHSLTAYLHFVGILLFFAFHPYFHFVLYLLIQCISSVAIFCFVCFFIKMKMVEFHWIHLQARTRYVTFSLITLFCSVLLDGFIHSLWISFTTSPSFAHFTLPTGYSVHYSWSRFSFLCGPCVGSFQDHGISGQISDPKRSKLILLCRILSCCCSETHYFHEL